MFVMNQTDQIKICNNDDRLHNPSIENFFCKTITNMAEIQASDYLTQIRSMNEQRGMLGHLAVVGTPDLRNTSIIQEYKPFTNPFGSASNKNNISIGISPHNMNINPIDGGNAHNQITDMKQSYSPPSTPHSPNELQEQKVFAQKQNMIPQQQQHHVQNQHLQNQIINVRDTKPYKCSSCSKTFANSSYLSQHTRIHLGIKPYRCDICQRKFTQLSHLQQHIRTHTGDKPYKCRHLGCPKAFSQLSNLQSHSRCHASDKPYKCNSCYKCFTDEQTLLEHIPRHKDSKHLKTHICNLCGKSYTQETYLEKHLQKHAEKAEKQSRAHQANIAQHHNIVSGTSLYNLNRNAIAMNVAAVVAGDHPWSKVGSNAVAVTLAEVIQQQNHTNGYDFGSTEQQHHTQQQSNTVSENSASISNNSNEENNGEDLRQHHHTSTNTLSVATADAANNSAFTPITVASQLSAQIPPRPYLYDALSFQTVAKTVNNAAGTVTSTPNFPNQLISLHQIRNYAHQPENIISLATNKDKNQ